MKNSVIVLVFSVLFITVFFNSCKKRKDDVRKNPSSGEKVYYISNEGAFGFANASISLYYPEDKNIINQAFLEVNGYELGDVVQSIFKANNHLFMIVNASNKIEISDTLLNDVFTIKNISLPRYMAAISEDRAVVSCWGNGGELLVINTSNYGIEDSIEVGNGPEKLLVSGGKIFVCNSGGFQSDSVVSVVDIAGFQTQNIAVEDNPVDIVRANNQSIWVLCQGKIIYDASWQPIGETKAALVEINPQANAVIQTIPLDVGDHPTQLEISPDKTTLYFGGGYGFTGIYTFDIQSSTLSTSPLINKSFYGFNVEPNDGDLYCLESPSFSSSGRVIVYSPKAILKAEVKTGIGPNGILF